MAESLMALENQRHWNTRRAVEAQSSIGGTFPGEQAVLLERDAELRGNVLEIGAGAGRLSAYLHGVARSYVGIDYSPAMVERARRCLPALDFRVGDARVLSPFADASFDAVCMFGSAIDDVELHDRRGIIGEVRRVLRPGGAFIFSSHNLDSTFRPAWSPSWLRRGIRSYLRGIANAAIHRRRQVRGNGWAILNDPHDSFGVLTLYVRKEMQVQALEQSGFTEVGMYAIDEGRRLGPGDVCGDYAICYTATRR